MKLGEISLPVQVETQFVHEWVARDGRAYACAISRVTVGGPGLRNILGHVKVAALVCDEDERSL